MDGASLGKNQRGWDWGYAREKDKVMEKGGRSGLPRAAEGLEKERDSPCRRRGESSVHGHVCGRSSCASSSTARETGRDLSACVA